MHLRPRWLRLLSVLRRWFWFCWLVVYCYSKCGICNCSMFCCTLLYVHYIISIILMGKRVLVALLSLSSWCLVIIVWLILAVQWVCLQFVIVVFPDHTYILFLAIAAHRASHQTLLVLRPLLQVKRIAVLWLSPLVESEFYNVGSN